jgi:DNA polymerase III alpha subunit
MSSNGFTHLHLHSQYSLLDGAISFDKLFARCRALDMGSVALTDHGNLFGVIEFYTKAKAAWNRNLSRPEQQVRADKEQHQRRRVSPDTTGREQYRL